MSAINPTEAVALAFENRNDIHWMWSKEGQLRHISKLSTSARPAGRADLKVRCGMTAADTNLYADTDGTGRNLARPDELDEVCTRCAVSYVKAYREFVAHGA
jgi:hypothetical protein